MRYFKHDFKLHYFLYMNKTWRPAVKFYLFSIKKEIKI